MNKRRRFKAKLKRAERKKIHDRMCADGIHEYRGVFPKVVDDSETYEKIELSAKDFGAFVDAIERPPAPNAALRALMARHWSWEADDNGHNRNGN